MIKKITVIKSLNYFLFLFSKLKKRRRVRLKLGFKVFMLYACFLQLGNKTEDLRIQMTTNKITAAVFYTFEWIDLYIFKWIDHGSYSAQT